MWERNLRYNEDIYQNIKYGIYKSEFLLAMRINSCYIYIYYRKYSKYINAQSAILFPITKPLIESVLLAAKNVIIT